MSDQPIPNPFECARRAVGVTVALNPDDIQTVCPITRPQAMHLLDRHAAEIAARMLAAGQKAAVEIVLREGASS